VYNVANGESLLECRLSMGQVGAELVYLVVVRSCLSQPNILRKHICASHSFCRLCKEKTNGKCRGSIQIQFPWCIFPYNPFINS
jgi:hypothetical protein